MAKIKEFVSIVSTLVLELREIGLENLADNPEFVQKSAATVFINEYQGGYQRGASGGGSKAFQPSNGPEKVVTGEIENKTSETKTNKEGKKYKIYSITIDGVEYSAFDTKAFGGHTFSEGDSVKATVKQNGKYWNLVKVEPVEEEEDQSW